MTYSVGDQWQFSIGRCLSRRTIKFPIDNSLSFLDTHFINRTTNESDTKIGPLHLIRWLVSRAGAMRTDAYTNATHHMQLNCRNWTRRAIECVFDVVISLILCFIVGIQSPHVIAHTSGIALIHCEPINKIKSNNKTLHPI